MFGSKGHVLIVEDDPVLLKQLTFCFETHGYVVQTASGGTQGFAICQQNEFDLILSDVQMPEGDGITFLNEVRNAGNQTHFILMTGGAVIDETGAKRLGAHAYFRKPFSLKQLMSYVNAIPTQERTFFSA